MLDLRRRLQPPASANELIHNVLALVGLGPGSVGDAEAVYPIADRLSFSHTIFDDEDEGHHISAWFSCRDHILIRLAVEYAESSGTREFIVALKAHDGLVAWSRIIEPENSGLSYDGDTNTDGRYKALDGGELAIDCRGMAEYRVILLEKSGGVHFDMVGGVA